ncbi:MAG: zinc metallopeptidase [Defluviitaleaceae bacterium]|nr:zinc metallopeptidase [Defluviitaleaceae bacterium]
MFWFFDWTILILIPAMILTMWAQAKVSGNLNKYSHIATKRGMSGAAIAAKMLADHGIRDVTIERLPDHKAWADHYDPKAKAIRLSAHVHDSSSIAAVSVAVHEVGHALQHNEAYMPLAFRSGMFPVVRIGSGLAVPLIIAGIAIAWFQWLTPEIASLIINIGIILFTVVVVFQLITLPVEFNASKRAMELLETGRYLSTDDEIRGGKKVLNAAALTYVAAAAVAISQLIRLLLIASRVRE